jgi:hypothetical protein
LTQSDYADLEHLTLPQQDLGRTKNRCSSDFTEGENEPVKEQRETNKWGNLKTRTSVNRKAERTMTNAKEKPIVFLC